MLWILVTVIVLVGAEVFTMVKGKLERQGELKLIRVIGERGGPPEATGKFWGPGNIRVDRKRDRVCMIDSSFYKVIFWNLQDGTFIAELDKKGAHTPVPAGASVLQGDFVPSNGAFDGNGNLYVLDKVHNEVTVISPEYKITGTWKIPAPSEIAADDNQNIIYITDKSTNDVVAYSPEGKQLRRFGGDALDNPGFMAVDSQNGDLYVTDHGTKKVVVFSAQGKVKRSWKLSLNPVGNPDIDLAQGKVFVSEHDNQKVWVYSPNGNLLSEAEASYPGVMGVDSAGVVYLSGGAGIHQYRLSKKKSE
jgi:DNA-binding beta-propeller fold protein YncE